LNDWQDLEELTMDMLDQLKLDVHAVTPLSPSPTTQLDGVVTAVIAPESDLNNTRRLRNLVLIASHLSTALEQLNHNPSSEFWVSANRIGAHLASHIEHEGSLNLPWSYLATIHSFINAIKVCSTTHGCNLS
jgi:hypothetical protein